MSLPSSHQNIDYFDAELHDDISSVINGEVVETVGFDRLALRLFRYQFQRNIPYQNYCLQLGQSPETVQAWKDIPSLPTDAFKVLEYSLITTPFDQITRTFVTSGTTAEVKGQHHFPSLSLYEQSIVSGWHQATLPSPRNAIFLTPSPADAAQSSLSHMMGVMAQEYSDQAAWVISTEGDLLVDAVVTAAASKEPVAMLGTALAFLHLFEKLPEGLSLPPRSWAMETGGYKGTSRKLEKSELYRMFHSKLGMSANSVINEYSMTELSSQFYTRGLDSPHVGPAWARIRVVDPVTGADTPIGQPGHLVIYDLANMHSVMAIRTQDVAIAQGENSFVLLGRDPSALPRGCSRAADQTLQAT